MAKLSKKDETCEYPLAFHGLRKEINFYGIRTFLEAVDVILYDINERSIRYEWLGIGESGESDQEALTYISQLIHDALQMSEKHDIN